MDIETLCYVVEYGTDNRWCYDTGNLRPRVYDTRSIAQDAIDRHESQRGRFIPITIEEYRDRYEPTGTDRGDGHFIRWDGSNRLVYNPGKDACPLVCDSFDDAQKAIMRRGGLLAPPDVQLAPITVSEYKKRYGS